MSHEGHNVHELEPKPGQIARRVCFDCGVEEIKLEKSIDKIFFTMSIGEEALYKAHVGCPVCEVEHTVWVPKHQAGDPDLVPVELRFCVSCVRNMTGVGER